MSDTPDATVLLVRAAHKLTADLRPLGHTMIDQLRHRAATVHRTDGLVQLARTVAQACDRFGYGKEQSFALAYAEQALDVYANQTGVQLARHIPTTFAPACTRTTNRHTGSTRQRRNRTAA